MHQVLDKSGKTASEPAQRATEIFEVSVSSDNIENGRRRIKLQILKVDKKSSLQRKKWMY